MRQRKFGFLFVALLVAFGLLFTGGEARANFAAFKYDIGVKPTIPANNSGTYEYTFTKAGSSSTQIKNVLFEIPVDIGLSPTGTNNGKLKVHYDNTTELAFTIFEAGVGDPDTRLGLGDNRFNVLRIDPPATGFSKDGFTLKLTLDSLTIDPDKKLSGTKTQVVQLKSQNNQSDADAVIAPTLESSILSASIVTFEVSPPEISFGECANPTDVMLKWDTENAQYVFISNINNGVVDVDGTLTFTLDDCPLETTTYTLTAIGFDGVSDTATAILTVRPPPIGVDSEFLSVEGHPGYAMELRKDLYGVFTEICLVDAETKIPVIDQDPLTDPPTECCTTGGDEFVCNPDPGNTSEEVKLNLGNLGSTVVLCTGGTPTPIGGLNDPEGCGYAKFYSLETGAKSGEGTCGWKFFYGRYAYICF